MYVRIARFEGVQPGGIARQANELHAAIDAVRGGPVPEAIPADAFRTLAGRTTRVLALANESDGVILDLVFVETAEDLVAVDGALDALSPAEGAGRRVAVERYEVLADERLR
jgi:hypothetical protein